MYLVPYLEYRCNLQLVNSPPRARDSSDMEARSDALGKPLPRFDPARVVVTGSTNCMYLSIYFCLYMMKLHINRTIRGREKRPSRHGYSAVRRSVVKRYRYTTETRKPWRVFVSSITLAQQSYLVSNTHTASLLHAKSS
jgi:hypothetical protein